MAISFNNLQFICVLQEKCLENTSNTHWCVENISSTQTITSVLCNGLYTRYNFLALTINTHWCASML